MPSSTASNRSLLISESIFCIAPMKILLDLLLESLSSSWAPSSPRFTTALCTWVGSSFDLFRSGRR